MKKLLPVILLLVPILSHAQALKSQPTNENGNKIYSGKVSLTGSYHLETDSYDGKFDGLHFYPDDKSIALLPEETLNSAGASSILLRNKNNSLRLFKLNPKQLKKGECYEGDKVTVTIENYIYSPISWGWRSANLISVKDMSKPKIVKCNP